jgi:hypothetical protein
MVSSYDCPVHAYTTAVLGSIPASVDTLVLKEYLKNWPKNRNRNVKSARYPSYLMTLEVSDFEQNLTFCSI